MLISLWCPVFFFFNDTATTEIYTLSLHDALPIYPIQPRGSRSCRRHPPIPPEERRRRLPAGGSLRWRGFGHRPWRSEEHTSELQSRPHLVCRLLLEKKKKKKIMRSKHNYRKKRDA